MLDPIIQQLCDDLFGVETLKNLQIKQQKDGLKIGVVFLPFPFSAHGLQQAVQTQKQQNIYHEKDLTFDPQKRQLSCGQDVLSLTEKEAKLLAYIFEHRGQIIDKSQMLKDVWGYHDTIETQTLPTHLSRLKKKLDKIWPGFKVKTTERGYQIL